MITRRKFVAGASAGVAGALLAPSLVRAQQAPLVLWGPPATPSLILAQAAQDAELAKVAPGISFAVWRNPDEMRAGIASGDMSAVIVPVYAAANFYNRGLSVRLANTLTDGLLYVVSADEGIQTTADLKGKTIACPFKNDMPDYMLQRLFSEAGLVVGTDVTIEYTATPPEGMQLLLAGRVDAIAVPEPVASGAIAAAKAAGKTLYRSINVREEWFAATGTSSQPSPGLAVTASLGERIGDDGIEVLQQAIERAVEIVNARPQEAAALAAEALGLPVPVIAEAVGHSNLVARRAQSAKAEIEALFNVLAEADPRIIGGKLPDDGFYAL
ncbi:ABC transporter substrate-binding protein [Devosia sp.]|uniref:ABC transporter substrate-binding protein n=1 Tax=Devosia sp. TaxID=1871048 RepID=UPI0025E84640|nr:ABC transporter substrate-binding protein [Devosia sp.]MCR6634208.1 ABC transporter substrate-binding protein [Devosia sp.]